MRALLSLCLFALSAQANLVLNTDITLPSQPKAGNNPNTTHIKDNGTNQVIILQVGNSMSAFFYNSNATVTSTVSLPGASPFNIPTECGYIGTNLFVLSGTTTNVPVLCHYGLSPASMPTTATLVTNFVIGDTNSRGCVMVNFTNGLLAVVMTSQNAACFANLTLRFTDGSWTNYGNINVNSNVSYTTPTEIYAAENPADESLWTFFTKDGWHFIETAQFVTSSNSTTGLFYRRDYLMTDDNSGDLQNYHEICFMDVVTDYAANKIRLVYNNSDVLGSYAADPYPVTQLVSANFGAGSTNTVLRLSGNPTNAYTDLGWIQVMFTPYSLTTVGNRIYMMWFHTDLPSGNHGPFCYQEFTDSLPGYYGNAIPLLNYYSRVYAFHQHRLDFVMQNPVDFTYHLLLFTDGVYYVRTDGNDANTGLGNSAAEAWRHIAHANGVVTAGNIVRVQPGIYDEQPTLTTAGASNAFINYVADSAGGPVVCRGFDLNGASYTRLTGFEITHTNTAFSSGVILEGTINHVEVIDNYIHNTFGAQAIRATAVCNPSYITFRGNTIFYPGVVYGVSTNSCPYGIAMCPVNPHHILSEYNTIQRAADVFINNYGTNCIIRNNYLYDFKNSYFNTDNTCHSDLFQDGSDGIQTGSRFHVYERNAGSDCVEVNSHGGFWHDSSNFGDTNMLVRGNVFWNFGSGAIGVQCVQKVCCYDNSFYNCSLFFTYFKAGSETEFPTNPIIANCIGQLATDNVDDPFTIYAGSNPQLVAGNVAFQCAASPNVQLVSDPKFVSAAANNFRLQSSSPARGFGTNVAYVTSANSSGTTFSVNDSQLFIDGWGLVDGDIITVGKGGPVVNITSNNWANNTLTVNATVTWTNKMPIYWGTNTAVDSGAYPYGSTPLTSADINQSGVTYTVSTAGDTRGVWFYQDGIPTTWVSSPPYTANLLSGTVTAKAYALYAQTQPVVPVVPIFPPPPQIVHLIILSKSLLNGKVLIQ